MSFSCKPLKNDGTPSYNLQMIHTKKTTIFITVYTISNILKVHLVNAHLAWLTLYTYWILYMYTSYIAFNIHIAYMYILCLPWNSLSIHSDARIYENTLYHCQICVHYLIANDESKSSKLYKVVKLIQNPSCSQELHSQPHQLYHRYYPKWHLKGINYNWIIETNSQFNTKVEYLWISFIIFKICEIKMVHIWKPCEEVHKTLGIVGLYMTNLSTSQNGPINL